MAHRERRSERIGWHRAGCSAPTTASCRPASLVVGVAAAEATRQDVLVAGVAGLVAGALSMAAGEYTWNSTPPPPRREATEEVATALGRPGWAVMPNPAAWASRRGVDKARTAMLTSPAPLIVVISAIVALAITGNLFDASPYVIAAQAMAVTLSVWARRSFPKSTFRVAAAPGASSIIRRGPYRFVRHPMYSAALLFIWAAILSHSSPWTLTLGVVVTLVVSLRLIAEERLLRTRYSEYGEYARSTTALIPFVL